MVPSTFVPWLVGFLYEVVGECRINLVHDVNLLVPAHGKVSPSVPIMGRIIRIKCVPREAKSGTNNLVLSIGYRSKTCVYIMRMPLAKLKQIQFLRGDFHLLVPGTYFTPLNFVS